MTVTASQLRDRAEVMEARWKYFEEMATRQHGTLKRHETWRREYASFHYLLGTPDERLGSRFKDVFMNQAELDTDAQLVPLPIGEEQAVLTKFTHLLEEYGLRTGSHPPSDVIAAARAPAVKYFANGEPIAKRIFSGYSVPATPFTVKYGRREFLEPMKRTGRLRICPASYYNNATHNAAVKDDEIHRTFFIPTFRERLKGIHHNVSRTPY